MGQLSAKTQVDFADIVTLMEERKQTRDFPDEDVGVQGDWQFDKYMETLSGPDLHDQYGNFDIQRWRTFEARFQIENGPEVWAYIQRRLKSRRNMAPLVLEFDGAKEELSEYWTLQDRLFPENMALTISDYLGRDNTDRAIAKQVVPGLALALRRLDLARRQYRIQNPEIDWLLVKFYDSSPRTAFAKSKLDAWKEHQRAASRDDSLNESSTFQARLSPIGPALN